MVDWNREKIRCLICNSDKLIIISRRVRHGENCCIVKCKDCSFIYMNPQPSEEGLDKYYQKEYRIHYKAGDSPSESQLLEEKELAQSRLNHLGPYLKRSNKILDYGCGTGTFLSFLKRFRIETWGVEPHDRYRKFAFDHYGLDKIKKGVDDIDKDIRFDTITLFHVLEHLKDPVGMIKSLSKRLKNEGILAIEVPNTDNFWLHTPWAKEVFLHEFMQPAHLWYFNPYTLCRLVNDTGMFQIVKIMTAGAELPLPEKLNKKLKKAGLYRSIRDIFYCIPDRLGKGENITIILKKS